jgi:hypothetical protein
MTIEDDDLREEILGLMRFPHLSVPNYSADPIVLRRVGTVLADTSARVRVRAAGGTWD